MATKAYKLTIKSIGKNPIQFIQDIKAQFEPELQDRLNDLADETVDEMREIIKVSKKRPSTGETLEKAIEKEILNSIAGITIGIGNISNLPVYWDIINSGGYVPPQNVGYFGDRVRAPEVGNHGEQWNHTGKGSGFFMMKPKKPIEGIDYVGIAARHLKQKLDLEIKDWIYKEIDKLARSK